MNYWLMKSEPETYGIDHLKGEPNKIEHWDGIRNYQARNMMRDDMKTGDLAFFYHSNCKEPAIVGSMTIVTESYPDFTAFDPKSQYYDPKSTKDKPRWFMVDVKFKQKFKHPITLQELRKLPELENMLILRKGNRLSITPVEKMHWDLIMELMKN